MAKDTITLEISQDFYDWWQKQVYSKDQGLMYVAWAAWNACKTKYEKYNHAMHPDGESLCEHEWGIDNIDAKEYCKKCSITRCR